mgnify:CR=1 FL=1
MRVVAILALALALAPAGAGLAAGKPAAKPTPATLASTRTLVAKLAGSGRGEARVTVSRGDPLGGPDRVDEGRLALEPPDRVRLDFGATGERIALRGDGGEWVQPATRPLGLSTVANGTARPAACSPSACSR